MSAATQERLTWDEICRRYPDEWVLLYDGDFVDDPELSVRAAKVWMHSRESGPLMDILREVPPGDIAVYYTGDDPTPGMAFML